MTELAGGAIGGQGFFVAANNRLRRLENLLIILPQRPRIALAVGCLEIVWDLPAMYIPDKRPAPSR